MPVPALLSMEAESMKQTDCPAPLELIDFCVGKLSDEKIDNLVNHLDHCSRCEGIVREIEKVPIPFIAYHLADSSPKSTGYLLDPRFLQLLDELKRLKPGAAC